MALIHTHFFSESLGMSVAADVILPQDSNKLIGMDTATRAQKHPVLWLLHGASDNHTIWQRRTSIERYVAPLGLAVVMPNVHLSGYADMAHGGKYYTYISSELPKIMRQFFPLSENREDNFISGLSMGGGGCMKIGLANPGNYAAIGCLSAGAVNHPVDKNGKREISDAFKPMYQRIYGERNIKDTEEDVLASAQKIIQQNGPFPKIYHSIGKDDFLLHAAHYTRDFFKSVPGNPFQYTYNEDEGSHTWEYWDEHIQQFLAFIKTQLIK